MTHVTHLDLVPDIELKDQDGNEVSLAQMHGRNVVLFYMPDERSVIAATEAEDFEEARGRFEALNAEVIGVSAESARSHRRFAKEHGLHERLLADRKERLAKELGLKDEDSGRVMPATILIDSDGRVQTVYEGIADQQRIERILNDLQRLHEAEGWSAPATLPAFL